MFNLTSTEFVTSTEFDLSTEFVTSTEFDLSTEFDVPVTTTDAESQDSSCEYDQTCVITETCPDCFWQETFCNNPFLRPSKIETLTFDYDVPLGDGSVLTTTVDLKCYLYCDETSPEYYYEQEQQDAITTAACVVSIFGLIFAILLCINVCVAHFQDEEAKQQAQMKSPTGANARRFTAQNQQKGGQNSKKRKNTTSGTSTPRAHQGNQTSTTNLNVGQEQTGTERESTHTPTGSERAAMGVSKPQIRRTRTLTNQFKSNFKDRPFTYDVPFCINIGYTLAMLAIISPYVFGRDNVVCNDDKTVTTQNPSSEQGLCSFIAVVLLIAIHVISLYQAALAASLFIRLSNPTTKVTIKRWHIHSFLWFLVICIVIGVLALDVMGGDFVLGFCTSGLSDSTSLLYLNVIPTGIYWMVGLGFLIGSGVLLRQHLQYTSKASRNKIQYAKMRRFFKRFMTYGLMSTCGSIVYWASVLTFYVNFDTYKGAASDWVLCSVEQYLTEQELRAQGFSEEQIAAVVQECDHDGAPPAILYLLLPITAMSVTLAGLILSCTDDNFIFWKDFFQTAAHGTMRRMRTVGRQGSQANLSANDAMQVPHKSTVEFTDPDSNTDRGIIINDGDGGVSRDFVPDKSPITSGPETPKSPSTATLDGPTLDTASLGFDKPAAAADSLEAQKRELDTLQQMQQVQQNALTSADSGSGTNRSESSGVPSDLAQLQQIATTSHDGVELQPPAPQVGADAAAGAGAGGGAAANEVVDAGAESDADGVNSDLAQYISDEEDNQQQSNAMDAK